MARTTPHIAQGLLIYRIGHQEQRVRVGSPEWMQWLADEAHCIFRFTHPLGNFSARRERRHDSSYWYAYSRRGGLLQKVYLGRTQEITLARLQQVTQLLARRFPDPELPQDALLMTKLIPPVVPPLLVARPRLLEQLTIGLRGRLTLIAAPAGYGKTTLLSAWQMSEMGNNWPVAWLSLDTADNEPIRFWRYTIAALRTLDPSVGVEAVNLLQAPHPPPLERVVTSLINSLACITDPFLMVLDDYHVITTPAIHEALTFLLYHAPAHFRLVLMSRVEPPLPLMRLRAHGEVTEIRTADLCFNHAEVATLLAQSSGLALGNDDLDVLMAQTEGWIASLILAIRTLPVDTDGVTLLRSLIAPRHPIIDYLVEDVLQNQPAPIQRFLLDTALLSRFSVSLCAAVTEQQDVASLLEQLERSNLFIEPIDPERRWYRYHPLFAAMLRRRAQQLQPERMPLLYRRAAAWYAQQQVTVSGEWEQAVGLTEPIAVHAPPTEQSNRVHSPLVEPLSSREVEVLQLLAAGLESPQIASELIIGVNTVRTHIKHIYGKLGVHSRLQAVERARELGLLRIIQSPTSIP